MEPLGQSQVLEPLKMLAQNHQITLLSYEKASDWADKPRREALKAEVRGSGIAWLPLRYHKRPTLPATAWDVLAGLIAGASLTLRRRIEIVHARGYVPALMALCLKRFFGLRFIFDMRGFWADEKVEGGTWKAGGALYRMTKWFEKRFLLGADVVVSLSRAGVAVLREFPYLRGRAAHFEVIPTCANMSLFRPLGPGPARPFTVGCVGSVGLWYMFDEMLECFKIISRLRPEARLLILNRGDHDAIRRKLAAHAIAAEMADIKAVSFRDVPAEMAKMDAGLFFIKPVFSKIACAPTKLAEFLACGVPCLSNARVGDYAEVLEGENVGAVVSRFSPAEMEKAARKIITLGVDPDARRRCAETARRLYSLESAAEAYDALYHRAKEEPACR